MRLEEEPEEPEKIGFINNLTPEELIALEEKKARAAAAVLAARERETAAKAKHALDEKKEMWKKKKADMKFSKFCEQNGISLDDGWYLCSICSVRAGCEAVLEAHLAGKEHAKRVANAEWYAAQDLPSDLPPYCETTSDGWVICQFCLKRTSPDLMIAHLTGKEHAKKCANIDIPTYGEPLHRERASEYIQHYGYDMWSRQHHWPESIVDEANAWACTLCCKRFITPSAVNAHLLEKHRGASPAPVVSETARPPQVKEPSPAVAPTTHWCEICHLPFASIELLQKHEMHDTVHLLVLHRLEEPLIDI